MVILTSTPEDVNFYQENMIHDVGHDYFGGGNRVENFKVIQNMVHEYLSSYRIQSGGARTKFSVRKEAYLGLDGRKFKINRSPKPASTKKRSKNRSPTRTSSYSDNTWLWLNMMEENVRPMLEDVFYQLHFYYYTLRLNRTTLNFDKDVTAFFFYNELKSTGNSEHENMYNNFVFVCWVLFNNNIGDLEKYKNLTTLDLVPEYDLMLWTTLWNTLKGIQYGGADGFECTDNGNFSFTITPLSIDGRKFNKSRTVTVNTDRTTYGFSANPGVTGSSTSDKKEGIIKWIQDKVTKSVIKTRDSREVKARKEQINDCITKQVDRIVGNLPKLTAIPAPAPAPPKGKAKSPAPDSTTPATSGSSSAPATRKGKAKSSAPAGDTSDDTSDDKVTTSSNEFIMIVMAWFYQNFIGDYGDTMNHFLRAESDVFELFKKFPKSKWTEQDENIMRASQHIVSSHSTSIIKDDLRDRNSMNAFHDTIRALPDGTNATRYLIDNAGKKFHLSTGNVICPLSSMMDGITLEMDAVGCPPLKTLPLNNEDNIMTAPEIGNMAVYLHSVENRARRRYNRKVELERYTRDGDIIFTASFVGNGSNKKDQTFTSTMTLKLEDNNKIGLIFTYKYDDNDLNVTQQRFSIDPDLYSEDAEKKKKGRKPVIVAGDIFRSATKSLINLENDNEFISWKSNVTAHEEKIIARMVLSAYSCLIFKSFGDILQEWNAVLKGGGYVLYQSNPGDTDMNPVFVNDNHLWKAPLYANDVAENERFLGRDSEPVRVIVCADRPSATRVLWSLYNAKKRLDCNSDWSSWINSNCTGGYIYRELNPVTNTQTLGDEEDSSNDIPGSLPNPSFTAKITSNVRNYFMYNPRKETSYTFEASTFVLDNALAENGKTVSIAFNNGVYSVSFGDSNFTFNEIAYPGNTNDEERKPHPIVFNLISEWLLNNNIDIRIIENDDDDGIVTSISQSSMLCYRKKNNDLCGYYLVKLNKQFNIGIIVEPWLTYYENHRDKIENYFKNDKVKCMISSLNKGVNKAFKVYLVPAKFEKAYDENTTISRSHDINIDTIFTVENCAPAPAVAIADSTDGMNVDTDVPSNGMNVDNNNAPASGSSSGTSGSVPAAAFDPNLASSNPRSTSVSRRSRILGTQRNNPVPSSSNKNGKTIPDDRVFTVEQITNALKPTNNSQATTSWTVYNREKLKFVRDMTFMEIKNVKLKGINTKAFYDNLAKQTGGASSNGQEQKDEDNSAAYGAIAIGLIIGLFTGFKV